MMDVFLLQSLERKDSLKLKTMKKHGHLRVKEDGQLTYKRVSCVVTCKIKNNNDHNFFSLLMVALQL